MEATMVDKHAISPLNQGDKTPGQHIEGPVKQPSLSRFTRRAFLGGGKYGRDRYFSSSLPAVCSCRRSADASGYGYGGNPWGCADGPQGEWPGASGAVRASGDVAGCVAGASSSLWHKKGMRSWAVWGVHGIRERTADQCLPDVRHHAPER